MRSVSSSRQSFSKLTFWDAVGQDHEHLAGLADGGEGDVLDGGVVAFENLRGNLGEALGKAAFDFLEEGIVAGAEVGLEGGEDADAGADAFGDGRVLFEEAGKWHGGDVHAAGEEEVFAEGEAGEVVDDLAAGEVAFHAVEAEHGGAGVDEMEAGKVVVEVLEKRLPAGEVVDLVEEDVGPAVGEVVFDEVGDIAVGEPEVVEGCVEGQGWIGKGCFDALEEGGCLAATAGALEADQPVIPINGLGGCAAEGHGHGGDAAAVGAVQFGKVFRGGIHGSAPCSRRTMLKQRNDVKKIMYGNILFF